MPSNLYVLPAYGKPITLDDQGTYCVLNHKTGAIQTVIQVVYERDNWLMYQLQQTTLNSEYCWTLMADSADMALQSLSSEKITRYFSKPEFAEPKGAWQVIANSQFGFGKFTPLDASQDIAHAIIMFGNGGIRSVLKLHLIDIEQEQQAVKPNIAKTNKKQVEFA
jgi:hypothetical protein